MAQNESWETILARLRQEYLEGMPARLEKLEQLLSRLEQEPENDEVLYDAYRLVHGLKGSGKQYGFPALSEEGRSMEDVLRAVYDHQSHLTPQDLNWLKRKTSECETLIANSA